MVLSRSAKLVDSLWVDPVDPALVEEDEEDYVCVGGGGGGELYI